MFNRINTVLKQRPLLVSLIGNTVKTAAADVITQSVIEQKNELDYKRLGLFTTFGCVYLGGWQYFLFNKVFVSLERHMIMKQYKKLTTSALLTFLDLGVHTPFLYFPAFYALKGYVDSKPIIDTIHTFQTNLRDDIVSMWNVWLPAQFVNFACVPVHMRMPFITCVSFAWTIILSMQRGN
jgi:protein Mpv17